MEDKWKITGKTILSAKAPCIRSEIAYYNPKYPEWHITARKHAEVHATGSGEWSWTDYEVWHERKIINQTFHRLMDAKEFVQQKAREQFEKTEW